MPVLKVPIVHKFGIISQSYRDELQERIQRNMYVDKFKEGKLSQTSNDSLEVNEEFVNKFNATTIRGDREKIKGKAKKMLERAKRRCGVTTDGIGKHVDLPLGWTELAQLAQCKDTIQNNCFGILSESLRKSPLDRHHIPGLFYLAETTLFWLRTDSIGEPFLKENELKLFDIGMNVFFRLFYHYMAGELTGYATFKNRLYSYLDGFIDALPVYEPYPFCCLAMKFINEIGRMLTCDMEEIPPELGENTKTVEDGTVEIRPMSMKSQKNISSFVHDLSPTLWHSLDVWKNVNDKSSEKQAKIILNSIINCVLQSEDENWVDIFLAIFILGNAAEKSLSVLQCLYNIAQTKKLNKQYKSTKFCNSRPDTLGTSLDAKNEERETIPTLADDGSIKTRVATAIGSLSYDDKNNVDYFNNFKTWPWQCTLALPIVLRNVVINGSTSVICKTALVGGDDNDESKKFSLLNLLFYEDSWMVRCIAYESVWKVYRKFEKDTLNENLSNAAWQAILHVQRYETDVRVLDSGKLGESVGPPINYGLRLFGQIAENLSKIYLPQNSNEIIVSNSINKPIKKPPKRQINYEIKIEKNRTSLRDEMNLANALYESLPGKHERMNYALRRIIEDQWRKEEHEILENDKHLEKEELKQVTIRNQRLLTLQNKLEKKKFGMKNFDGFI